ncbi:hypothetical protein CVT26_011733 [Gymnopilus dilepis]|uniref:Uncharacterized protein n=1 Tax=Gymnopilus dilepis TaxID=231916 RepID=A0A409W5X1_9AGAR|nr:hypothetical protein CVT26_011733 [Gymnopilus dilepis]
MKSTADGCHRIGVHEHGKLESSVYDQSAGRTLRAALNRWHVVDTNLGKSPACRLEAEHKVARTLHIHPTSLDARQRNKHPLSNCQLPHCDCVTTVKAAAVGTSTSQVGNALCGTVWGIFAISELGQVWSLERARGVPLFPVTPHSLHIATIWVAAGLLETRDGKPCQRGYFHPCHFRPEGKMGELNSESANLGQAWTGLGTRHRSIIESPPAQGLREPVFESDFFQILSGCQIMITLRQVDASRERSVAVLLLQSEMATKLG